MIPLRQCGCLLLMGISAVLAAFPTSHVNAAVHNWTEPDLDWLAYVNASGPGNRAFGPSWIGGLELDGQTNEFIPKGNDEPSRLGMPLVAFEDFE